MATEIKPHDTYVLGLNEENKIVFFKTYNYETESDSTQADLAKIQEEGLIWETGYLKNKLQELIDIEKKWNDLYEQIGDYYFENEEGETELSWNLNDIGKKASKAFGYM